MKKISILLLVIAIATSCAVGTYYPYAQNNFGAQSTVVLDKANFRVVRDVEAIVDVNNTRLTRANVAQSAYGQLLRTANLTGSQVLINVVIEEVRRESGGFFRLLFGMPKRVQHVAARATIIEFLDENGNPRVSEAYRPNALVSSTTNHSATHIQESQTVAKKVEKNIKPVQETKRIETETKASQPIKETKIIETETISSQSKEMASKNEIEQLKQSHNKIENTLMALSDLGFYSGREYKTYSKIYKTLPLTKENISILTKIQSVLFDYYETQGKAYPTLEKQLKNASSMEEQIQIFLSYYK